MWFRNKSMEDNSVKYDRTKAYKYFKKAKDGYEEMGVVIFSEHPCYNDVKAILNEYKYKKEKDV